MGAKQDRPVYNKGKGVYSEATDFTAQIINANDNFVRNEQIAQSIVVRASDLVAA